MNKKLVLSGAAALVALGLGSLGWQLGPVRNSPKVNHMLTPSQTEKRDRMRLTVHVLADQIGERNTPRPKGLEEAARYLEQQLESIGYNAQSQRYRAGGVEVRNVFAEKAGTSPELPALLTGAHYDSVVGTVGANDNSSGVAALLEIARACKQEPTKRSLIFVFFVNEEPPYFQTEEMGSYVFARMLSESKKPLDGMISLETIGYYSDARGSQHYPGPLAAIYPTLGNFIGFVGDRKSAGWVDKVTGTFRKQTDFPAESLAAPADLTGISWSDHWSFSQFGYPSLMVTDTAPFRYPHYHTTEDTPDKIDYDRMTLMVDGLIRTVCTLAH